MIEFSSGSNDGYPGAEASLSMIVCVSKLAGKVPRTHSKCLDVELLDYGEPL